MKRFAIIMLCTLLLGFSLLPAVSATQEHAYTALFQETATVEEQNLAEYHARLNEAFISNPEEFLSCLAAESFDIQNSIISNFFRAYPSSDTTGFAEYKAAVTKLIDIPDLTEDEERVMFRILGNVDMVDPVQYSLPVDYTLLFKKASHSDGAYATMYALDLSDVFDLDPKGFLTALAANPDIPAERIIILFVYERQYIDFADFCAAVEALAQDTTLTAEETELLGIIQTHVAKLSSVTSTEATESSTQPPESSAKATEPSTQVPEPSVDTTASEPKRDTYQWSTWIIAAIAVAGTIVLLLYKNKKK